MDLDILKNKKNGRDALDRVLTYRSAKKQKKVMDKGCTCLKAIVFQKRTRVIQGEIDFRISKCHHINATQAIGGKTS